MFSNAAVICTCQNNVKTTMLDKLNVDFKKRIRDINCNERYPKGKTIEIRKEEVMAIRSRFPTKIPIIVRRYVREGSLPELDKSKFLVPQEITMSQFLTIIRNRMKLTPTQAIYLLINEKTLPSLSTSLAEVYAEHARSDGFLYVTYASQEVFGNDSIDSSMMSCVRFVLGVIDAMSS